MQLTERVALITGADSGIGRATAKVMAQQGAKVGMLSRDAADLEEAVAEVRQWSEAIPLVADISQADAMQKAVEQIIDKWGRLDIVFANAGINGVWAPLEELDPSEWNQTINVNLTGTFLTAKYAIPHLKRQGGAIIITSSVNGTRMFSNTGATAYACSKAAQVAFAKMVALELAESKIRVNVICPGAISTDIKSDKQGEPEEARPKVEFPEGTIPLTEGQSGTSEQVAQLVLFLASDASSHITGTEIWIDGGQSLLQG